MVYPTKNAALSGIIIISESALQLGVPSCIPGGWSRYERFTRSRCRTFTTSQILIRNIHLGSPLSIVLSVVKLTLPFNVLSLEELMPVPSSHYAQPLPFPLHHPANSTIFPNPLAQGTDNSSCIFPRNPYPHISVLNLEKINRDRCACDAEELTDRRGEVRSSCKNVYRRRVGGWK